MRVGAARLRQVLVALVLSAPVVTLAETPAPTPEAPAPAPAAPAPAAPARTEEPRLGFDESDLQRSSPAEAVAGAWAMMVKAVVALAAVLFLAYVILGKGLAKFGQKAGGAKRIHVVDRVGIDAKRTLYLVEVDGVRTLVGAGEGGMTIAVIPDAPKPAFKDVIQDKAHDNGAHAPPEPDPAALSITTPSKTQGDA